jgi:hypothetical protein
VAAEIQSGQGTLLDVCQDAGERPAAQHVFQDRDEWIYRVSRAGPQVDLRQIAQRQICRQVLRRLARRSGHDEVGRKLVCRPGVTYERPAGLVEEAGGRHCDLRIELEGWPGYLTAMVGVSAPQHFNQFSPGALVGLRQRLQESPSLPKERTKKRGER